MPILFILFAFMLYLYCEISLLVSLGSSIGVLPMLLLLIAISFIGLWFVKLRGLYTFWQIRRQLAQGRLPTGELLNSVLFVLAGILLIIPGFLSDLLAVFCVLPFSRRLLQNRLMRFFKNRISFRRFSYYGSNDSRQENSVFEAEFERRHDSDKRIK